MCRDMSRMMHIFRSMSIENVMSPRPALPRRRGGHGAAVFAQGPAWGQLGCPPRTALPRCRGEHGAAVRRASPAWGADVISSNVVGYNKIILQPGYNAISSQFVPVGANTTVDILDVADCTSLPAMDPDTETGEGFARLQTWTPGEGYTIYEWTGEGLAEAWDWEGIDNKWMTESAGDVAVVQISNGQGFWLWLDPNAVDQNKPVTISGQVLTNETTTVSLVAGYNLIANPYPNAIDIQDISFSNLPSMDPDTETGEGYARLQTWKPGEGYTIFEWTGDGLAEAWDWEGIDNKWMTESAGDVAEDVLIGVGESFWIWLDPTCPSLSGNVSVTFTNPID